MNFNEFWEKLQSELEQEIEFKTLKQNRKFTARFDHNKKGDLFVRITLKLGQPRGQIPFNEFEGVWDNAKRFSRESRFVNEDGRLDAYTRQDGVRGKTVHVSYITALINHIVKNQKME